MRATVGQLIWDSEDDYINESFWRIHPLFIMIQNGETAKLRESLDLQLDQHDFHERVSRDKRKELEYMTVSLVNTFMIAAIQGGVYPPEANWIADKARRDLIAIHKPSEIPAIINDTAIRLCEKVADTKKNDTGNPHVEKAKQYILTHLTQEITSADIAAHSGISQSHLSRLFKRLTGTTMMGYLSDERIRAAQGLLLSSDMTIPEIAALLRFCDQSHFTYAFRRKTGITPRAYKSKHLLSPLNLNI